ATLARAIGRAAPEEGDGHGAVELAAFEVPTISLEAARAAPALLGLVESLAERSELGEVSSAPGASLLYFAQAARLVQHLLAQQRFVPALVQTGSGELEGQWEPWVSDEGSAARVSALVASMPAS